MARSERIVIDTIGKMIDHGNSLTVYCNNQGCNHRTEINLHNLASRIGRDHACMRADLLPRFYCTCCGRGAPKDITLIYAPHMPAFSASTWCTSPPGSRPVHDTPSPTYKRSRRRGRREQLG